MNKVILFIFTILRGLIDGASLKMDLVILTRLSLMARVLLWMWVTLVF